MHMEVQSNKHALLIFSGGQDSTTCLAWALNRFAKVNTIGFKYGQTHEVELICRTQILAEIRTSFPHWCNKLGEDTVIDLPCLQEITKSALIANMNTAWQKNNLPATFVPGRNLFFILLAATLAYEKSCQNLILGVCEVDYSGYPDCRDDAVKAMQVAINLGMDTHIKIHTPLMNKTKREAWVMANKEGGEDFVELVRQKTHTCYLGKREQMHAWGYGCGTCPACILRAKGWQDYHNEQFGHEGEKNAF